MRNKECKISPSETCALHAQEAVSADFSESDACASASADSSYCSTHGSEASSESSCESSGEFSTEDSIQDSKFKMKNEFEEAEQTAEAAVKNESEADDPAKEEERNDTHRAEEAEEEDYARRAEEDMAALCALFPELSPDGEAISLGSLRNPTRFAELREAGLTVEEAFLASNYRMLAERPIDLFAQKEMKAHLRPALPRASGRAAAIPSSLLVRSRALFEGLSDSELASLYRRVTK